MKYCFTDKLVDFTFWMFEISILRWVRLKARIVFPILCQSSDLKCLSVDYGYDFCACITFSMWCEILPEAPQHQIFGVMCPCWWPSHSYYLGFFSRLAPWKLYGVFYGVRIWQAHKLHEWAKGSLQPLWVLSGSSLSSWPPPSRDLGTVSKWHTVKTTKPQQWRHRWGPPSPSLSCCCSSVSFFSGLRQLCLVVFVCIFNSFGAV